MGIQPVFPVNQSESLHEKKKSRRARNLMYLYKEHVYMIVEQVFIWKNLNKMLFIAMHYDIPTTE